MVTREPECSSMRIWVMALGKPPRPEEIEAKCEGNLEYIMEERNHELSVVVLRQL